MRLSLLMLGVLLASYGLPRVSHGSVCDQDHKSLVSAFYAIAMTHPDGFPDFVSKNRPFFTSDSQWRFCFGHIADALQAGAASGPSPDSIKERAYDAANRAGVPGMGEGLYKNMVKTSGELLTLSRHLRSLSQSIQGILNGHPGDYFNSEVYHMSSFVWTAMGNVWSPSAVEKLRKQFFNLYSWYLDELTRAM